MIYTTDEKRILDDILKAFADYIRGHDNFDIVYSEKIGYVKLQTLRPSDELPEVVSTPETLLDVLFNEIIKDVVFSSDNPRREHDDPTLTEYEKNESRRRIMAILKTMEGGDKACYLNFLDTYIKEYPKNGAQPRCCDGE